MMHAMLVPLVPNDARGRALGRIGTLDMRRHTVIGSPLAVSAEYQREAVFGLYEYDGTNVILSRSMVSHSALGDAHILFAPRTARMVRPMTGIGFSSAVDLPEVVTWSSAKPAYFYGTVIPEGLRQGFDAAAVDIDNVVLDITLEFDRFLADAAGLTLPHLALRKGSIRRINLPDLADKLGALGRGTISYKKSATFMQAAVGADGTCYVAMTLTAATRTAFTGHTVCYAIQPGADQPHRIWPLRRPPLHGMLVDRDGRVLVHGDKYLDVYDVDGRHMQCIEAYANVIKIILLRDGTLVMLHAPDGVISVLPTA